jgi:hypothetical protein
MAFVDDMGILMQPIPRWSVPETKYPIMSGFGEDVNNKWKAKRLRG